jgi:hypothetical protein
LKRKYNNEPANLPTCQPANHAERIKTFGDMETLIYEYCKLSDRGKIMGTLNTYRFFVIDIYINKQYTYFDPERTISFMEILRH